MGMVAILIDKTICINFQTPFNRRLHMKLKKLALEFQRSVKDVDWRMPSDHNTK